MHFGSDSFFTGWLGRAGLAALAMGGAASSACSSGAPGAPDTEGRATLEAIPLGLARGAHGPAVVQLTEDLRQRGYLPNGDLARLYPAWTPVVDEDPKDPSTFDEVLERALLAFQGRSHLETSGVIDTATAAALRSTTCAYPESGSRDPSEKWARLGLSRWNITNVTYAITSPTADISVAAQTAAVDAAFSTWAAATNLTFTRVASGTPNIEIKFYPDAAVPPGWTGMDLTGFGGRSGPPCNPGDIFCTPTRIGINDAANWALTPPNEIDLQGLWTHEIGHALGLDHSSVTTFGPPVMLTPWSTSDLHRTLLPDDKTGITSLYGAWQVQAAPNSALAVDVGGVGNEIWVAGTNTVSQWNGTTWAQFSGPPGVTIAAIAAGGNGMPWVVGTNNTIWSRSNGTWTQRPGAATDIGIAPFNHTWSIGTVAQGGGNFNVQRWNGTGWTTVAGAAKRVAVDLTGRPWVVQAGGAVFRRNAADTGWDALTGCATDITAGLDGSVWATGCEVVNSTEHGVWVWDEQVGLTGNNPTPAAMGWISVPGGAGQRLAIGPDQRPWTQLSNGGLLRRLPRCPSPAGFCS